MSFDRRSQEASERLHGSLMSGAPFRDAQRWNHQNMCRNANLVSLIGLMSKDGRITMAAAAAKCAKSPF